MEPVAVGCLIGIDDNIIAFPNANEEPLGSKWFDWNEIGSDDGHVMTIEPDFEVVVGRSVDQSESVLLALRQSIAVILSHCPIHSHIGAIDEDVFCAGRSPRKHTSLDEGAKLESRTVVVVSDWEGSEINVVV